MTETSNLSLEQRAMQGAAMTPEERKRMWLSISDITEAQFDAFAGGAAGAPGQSTAAGDHRPRFRTRCGDAPAQGDRRAGASLSAARRTGRPRLRLLYLSAVS